MSGNFEFLKKYNKEVFKLVSAGERSLKTDIIFAGTSLRKALERFVNDIAISFPEVKTIAKKLPDGTTTHNLINIMRIDINSMDVNEPYKVFSFNRITDDELFKCREDNKLCNRKYEIFNRAMIRRRIYDEADFVRIMGNDFTHENPKDRMFKRTYENILDAYRYFHRMLKNYYCKKQSVPDFKEDCIPIGNFEILSCCLPNDANITCCRREYVGKYIESDRFLNETSNWAIIREYRKEKMDENFLLRGYDSQILAKKDISGVPVGMTRIEVLSKFSNEKSPFYIIAYVFQRRPVPLAEVLSSLSDSNKYSIAIKIADCFRNLHNSKSPIYHRMFNYNCVYLCDYTDEKEYGEWLPAIVKFDFSKIEDSRVKTVFAPAQNAVECLNNKEGKYISPEWKSNPTCSNWEKVDIYALGVLLADIFSNKILDTVDEFFDIENLEDKIDNTILILIDEMLSNDVKQRPNANTVYQILIDCK